jgi:hypothetical protein
MFFSGVGGFVESPVAASVSASRCSFRVTLLEQLLNWNLAEVSGLTHNVNHREHLRCDVARFV